MTAVVLLTGATGFIGDRLHDPLRAAGYRVRCLTRRPERARERWPDREWVGGDAHDAQALGAALAGCQATYYLMHGMGDLSPGWIEREVAGAEMFARVAEQAGLERVIYLGGVEPRGNPSDHLRARLQTGDRLRHGRVPCAELRAGMIIGSGSASWTIVRDLAARLPAMILPLWLENQSQPVAVDDVVAALVAAATVPLPASRIWDLPGPETLSGAEVLLRIAELLGRRPLIAKVPLISPKLSSHWIRLVTRADYSLSAELVEGLTSDLVARHPAFWREAGLPEPLEFNEAAQRALRDDAARLRLPSRILEWLAARFTRSAGRPRAALPPSRPAAERVR
jgi:uncharacterized protein YbjT (DUF2867 family)